MAANMNLVASRVRDIRLPLTPYVHVRDRPGWRVGYTIGWLLLFVGAFLYGAMFALLPPAFVPPLLLPILLLILVVVWALPSARSVPTRLIYWLFLGFFVVLMAWPSYLAIALPGLPWISFVRIFGFPLALLLLVALSSSRSFQTETKQVLRQSPWAWRLLALFVACQFVSVFASDHPFTSLQKFVIAQVYWTAIFFTACFVFRTPGRVRTWALIMFGLALWVSLLGLWEWRISRLPWAGHIPSIFKIDNEDVARILNGTARAATGIYRVQGTSTTSLSLAEYLALTTPVLIHLIMEDRRFWLRLAALLSLPFLFFTIVNTGARLGALGFLLSFVLYAGLWAVRRWQTVKGSLVGPAITIAYPLVFALFIAATFFVGRVRRLVWGGGEHQFSTDARFEQIESGLPMILSNPLGHGAGEAAVTLGFADLEGLLTIDNYLLSIALEYGVIGFIAYFGFFVAVILYGLNSLFRNRLDYDGTYLLPLVIALSIFLVIKTVLSQEANHPVAFMIAGLICALVWKTSSNPLENTRARARGLTQEHR